MFVKGIRIFLKKKTTKSINMFVNNMEIFIRKIKNMVWNVIKIFLRMKDKG